MRLIGKVALVTGSGNLRGIGRGILQCLGRDGADVVIHYRSRDDEAKVIADEIREMGKKVLIVKGNLSKQEDIKQMFQKVIDEFGKLDIMVNNAGVCVWEKFLDISEEGFNRIVDVNMKGMMECSHHAANIMVKQGIKGRIINISSLQSKRPTPVMGVYSGTKAAMDHFTQSAALELAQYGITVNQVWPGFVDTDINSNKPELATEESKNKWLDTIPLGKAATPWDIGQAVSYLSGEEGQAITGGVIKVDGGAFIRSLQ
jgi:NAD(P)-dependent dehydrogenase (short-subunit alcohol dehydrogenase family)